MRFLLLIGMCSVVAMQAEDFDRKVASRGSFFAYPQFARLMQSEGTVDLLLDIDEKGAVRKAVVGNPASPSLFRQAAIDSILTWRFEPSNRSTQGAPFVYMFKFTGVCPQNPCDPELVFEPPNRVTITVKVPRAILD